MNDFITYRDELSKTERLFPLEKIGLAEYQYETGKLVIWLGGDETFAIDGDEAKRVWTELKSKKQKPEFAAQINLEHLREFFTDMEFFADVLCLHVNGIEKLRGALMDLKQSAIWMAKEIGQIQDWGDENDEKQD